MFNMSDNKKIGFGLTAVGLLFVVLGIMFFFDRTLLSFGNFAFLFGLCMLQGVPNTVRFFMKRDKMIGSAVFFLGFIVTLIGHSFFGTLLQLYGLWKLFASFLPNVISAVEMSPIGSVMQLPGLNKLSQWSRGQALPI